MRSRPDEITLAVAGKKRSSTIPEGVDVPMRLEGPSAEAPATQAGGASSALTWQRLVAWGPRANQQTSTLFSPALSCGSIFRNSFPRGLFVKIVFTKGHFEKVLHGGSGEEMADERVLHNFLSSTVLRAKLSR
jgi:hypothetical protein